MGRTEAVEYRRFRVIEIRELQDDLAAGRLLVPFVHMSGLHAADMHKIDREKAFWSQKCVGDYATDRATENPRMYETVRDHVRPTSCISSPVYSEPSFHESLGVVLSMAPVPKGAVSSETTAWDVPMPLLEELKRPRIRFGVFEVDLPPNYPNANWFMALALEKEGRIPEAIRVSRVR
jgi:hypothetical protein